MSPYVTSKFAAVGFNDSLRHELNVWEVPVISIEPDFFRTNLINAEHIDRLVDIMVGSLDADILEDYGKEYFEAHKQDMKVLMQKASTDIHLVIECIDSAISSVYPDVVYRPCGTFWNKILMHVYEVLPPNYQNVLMKILMSGGIKPKRVNERDVK
nr:dehydrogenase/reductase SDR family member 9-like [Parasteatoda tepidariorum]